MLLAPYNPEPPCGSRGCQQYDPTQSWYLSPRSGTLRLAAAAAEGYRCYEPGCYQLTSHLPAFDELCLARVASISAYGVDPTSDSTAGTDVYAGPLSGGAFVFGLLNRGPAIQTISATWEWAGAPNFAGDTSACIRELFSGATKLATGGVEWVVPSHDLMVLRVVPNATVC